MKIAVCVKQVPDTETKIKINSDASNIDDTGVKWVMNPYDEFDVEEALKTKQAAAAEKVVVISVGPKKRITETLRTALAMGADEAIAVDATEPLDSYATAKALAKVITDEGGFDVIFAGQLAIDDNASSVGQQLAENLDLPHSTVVSKLEVGDNSWLVERDTEGGTKEVIQLTGPSVIGANKGLNTPRYASLPGIMKAKKKPLKEVEFSSLGLSSDDTKVRFKDFQLPPEKPAVKILSGELAAQAKELTQLLREEAKVL